MEKIVLPHGRAIWTDQPTAVTRGGSPRASAGDQEPRGAGRYSAPPARGSAVRGICRTP